MTAVRLRESAAYGARLYAYLLGVTLAGGGALGLGLALAVPEATSLVGTGGADTTELAAGGVLGLSGLSVLAIGYLGTGYKLIADAVATGAVTDATDSTAPAPDAGGATGTTSTTPAAPDGPTDEPRRAPGVEPDSTPEGDAAVSTDGTESGVAPEADADDAYGSRATDEPPEPSPEEIAFGSSEGEGAEPGEPDEDERTESSSDDVRPAGRSAAADPLADPTEDE